MRKFILLLLLISPYIVTAQAPIAKFSATDTAVCAPGTVNFIDSSLISITSWKWDFPGGIPDTSTLQNPPPVSYSSPGNYTVKLVVGNRCCGKDSTTKTNYIHVYQEPSVSFTGPTNLCQGSGATITAYGGTQYHWDNGATTSSINITAVVTKTYTVKVANGPCFKDTSFTVNVDTMPTFTFRGNTHLCQGQSTTLYAYNPKAKGYKYLWNTGDTTDSLVTGPLYTSQTYYVSISENGGGGCSIDSAEITVNVYDCAGVETYTDALQIKVFPDPVDSRLLLQSSLPFEKSNILIITDMMGRKVYSESIGTLEANQLEINVSSLAPGIYFLQLQTNKGTIVAKFIKE